MLTIARLSHQLRPTVSLVSPTQRQMFSDAKKRAVDCPSLARARSGYIPHDQYERPIPKAFRPFHLIKYYWETIPLFSVTAIAVSFAICQTIWACLKSVDVVFSSHNRKNHSHTMDLCDPSVHKRIIIHQRYYAWPEMQCVLDKMKRAEQKLANKVQHCTFAKF